MPDPVHGRFAAFCIALICAGLMALSAACRGFPFNPSVAVDADAARAGVRRFVIDTGEFAGLSDLTIDASGHFWSAPEHTRALVRLNLTKDEPGIDDAPIPLEGVPAGADTESVAWMAEGKFAVGTETQVSHRPSDDVLLVSVEKGRARVTQRIPLPYKLWNLDAKANDGIEGLCYAAGHLVAGVEPVGRLPDGKRFAPIGRYDSATKSWTPFQLRLTSHIGKISALACRAGKGESKITVLAIERHFGVSRLLRFTIPETGTAADVIIPEVLVDFGRVIDAVPNLEGVTWSPQGDIFVLSDNNMGFVTGPTQVIFLPHSWP
jgi:hypothetical protein